MKIRLVPIPMMNPEVMKNPGTLRIVQELKISPSPKITTPMNKIFRAPYLLMMFEFSMAKKEIQAAVRPPTKLRVELLARPSSISRDSMIPNA
jgi:hypothetical protein